jgi:hypothetical protein
LKSLFQISEHLNTDVKGIYTTFGRLDENKEAHTYLAVDVKRFAT